MTDPILALEWLYDRVRGTESRRAVASRHRETVLAALRAHREREAAVRALHYEVQTRGDGPYCHECKVEIFLCPTLAILDSKGDDK